MKNLITETYTIPVFNKSDLELRIKKFNKRAKKLNVNPPSQKELMEIMGERFTEFLETSSSLVPVNDFDKKVYSAFDCQENLDDLRTFVKPYKAALK